MTESEPKGLLFISVHTALEFLLPLAEWSYLAKILFSDCAQVPFCCVPCLLGASQDVGINQIKCSSLNQDLNQLLVAFYPFAGDPSYCQLQLDSCTHHDAGLVEMDYFPVTGQKVKPMAPCHFITA